MPWLQERFDVGLASVRLFFVLSGFLITGILLRARADAEAAGGTRPQILRAFYARRFLRIFPAYYAVLLLAVAVGLPLVRETLGWHLAYLSNFYAYQAGWPRSYLGHLWSLSVEEQFYLAWPALVLFTPARRLPVVVLTVICLAPPSRVLFAVLCPDPWRAGVITTSCLDTLGAGALLALAWEAGPAAGALRRRLRRVSLALGLALLAALLASQLLGGDRTFRFAGKDLAYAMIFLWVVDRAAEGFGGVARHLLEARPIVYLGGISYGIYLYHEFVPALMRVAGESLGVSLPFPHAMGVVRLLAVIAVTVPVAALSWHLFEKPLNGLKSRFPYVPREARRRTAEGGRRVTLPRSAGAPSGRPPRSASAASGSRHAAGAAPAPS
jgi:peptidoglycan/LPS O-acetylase OafA/YrhL